MKGFGSETPNASLVLSSKRWRLFLPDGRANPRCRLVWGADITGVGAHCRSRALRVEEGAGWLGWEEWSNGGWPTGPTRPTQGGVALSHACKLVLFLAKTKHLTGGSGGLEVPRYS